MRRASKPTYGVNSALIVFTLVAAALMPAWFYLLPGTAISERESAATGHALAIALDRYAMAHGGEYPPTAEIRGGNFRDDALVKSRFMLFYPRNPFTGRPVENVPPNTFSPGNFSYARNAAKTYMFQLEVYGAEKKSGPRGDGVIYEH